MPADRNVKTVREQLRNLERRCLEAKVNAEGSDRVVVYASELDAIDEAIKVFDEHGPFGGIAWRIQECYDSHD